MCLLLSHEKKMKLKNVIFLMNRMKKKNVDINIM